MQQQRVHTWVCEAKSDKSTQEPTMHPFALGTALAAASLAAVYALMFGITLAIAAMGWHA